MMQASYFVVAVVTLHPHPPTHISGQSALVHVLHALRDEALDLLQALGSHRSRLCTAAPKRPDRPQQPPNGLQVRFHASENPLHHVLRLRARQDGRHLVGEPGLPQRRCECGTGLRGGLSGRLPRTGVPLRVAPPPRRPPLPPHKALKEVLPLGLLPLPDLDHGQYVLLLVHVNVREPDTLPSASAAGAGGPRGLRPPAGLHEGIQDAWLSARPRPPFRGVRRRRLALVKLGDLDPQPADLARISVQPQQQGHGLPGDEARVIRRGGQGHAPAEVVAPPVAQKFWRRRSVWLPQFKF
mmetsp:Transcript_2815/g.9686  ORF Transcript_2815/g.9686 Transcript_2815/m.9686 type:complete len:297 (+) Transcript_2815:1289-2179(+)